MSSPVLGLTMLGLIVIAIMMGFPTAFTLMGMGMLFGFVAFYEPGAHWYDNHIFDLMVQRTYGVMTNDTLLSIPLFVFMGYVIERAALVDKMFFSVQLAFRRLPASLAVTTLLVCAFWGIASGIVGAVVVLMGVIAMRPMLSAGYDVRLASGVITAGGTLGILIPPSVMIIVYAAIAGQSVVKLYAAAMLPGFFLTLLYLVYIIGWALINPKIAPKLPKEKYQLPVPAWLRQLGSSRGVLGRLFLALFSPGRLADARLENGRPVTMLVILKNLLAATVPLLLTAMMFAMAWWYVTIYSVAEASGTPPAAAVSTALRPTTEPGAATPVSDDAPPEELGAGTRTELETSTPTDAPVELGLADSGYKATGGQVPESFRLWFWVCAALSAGLLGYYYWQMDGEGFEILKMLQVSVVPLGVLTIVVLVVILLGITTATESAAVGALGALYLVALAKHQSAALWGSLVGGALGLGLGLSARRSADARCGDHARRHVWRHDLRTWVGPARGPRDVGDSQAGHVSHRENDRHGLLAVSRLRLVLGCLRPARRPGHHRALGRGHEFVAAPVHAPGAGDHLCPRLAAGVDGDHRHFHSDLFAVARPFPRRSAAVRHHGGRESAGRVPFSAGGDVGLLSQGRLATARNAQPDLRRHDALHADRAPLSGDHVCLAGHDALAAEFPLRKLIGAEKRVDKRSHAPCSDSHAWLNPHSKKAKRSCVKMPPRKACNPRPAVCNTPC